MTQYVIIGNGVAAAAAIEGIRSVSAEGRITVVSAEPHPVYARPLISYYLEDKTDRVRMAYRPADFYEKNGTDVLYGRRAEALDPAGRTVTLDDGTTLIYDKLCLATGSSPFVPPFQGLDTVPKTYSFLTLDDAEALKQAVTPASRVFIVGAGLIGLKCAEGLFAITKNITVCDLADRVLSSILDAELAARVQKHLETTGLKLMLGDSVASFSGNSATMQSGRTVDFDVLVLAIGVRANTALLKNAGGEVGRGMRINEKMQTSLADIYAAGDCTEGMDASLGDRRVLALLPNAYQQGFTAGVNMAGGDAAFDKAIPMDAMGLFGLHMMTAGTRFAPEQGGECYEESSESAAKKLFMHDGLLTGFMLLGETGRAGIYTAMIREKTPLASVNFELMKKNPTSAAYSEIDRRKMFGGVI